MAAPAVPNWGGFSEFMIAATLFTRFADGEIWTHIEDKSLHLLCREGSAAFEALPSENKHMGPWTGREGEVDGLRLSYRSMLAEQAFVVIYAHVSKLELEAPAGLRGPLAENAECPQCKGSALQEANGS